jgi:hypothetical protein
MGKSVKGLQKLLDNDPQWQAFVNTNAIIEPVTMGVASKVSARTPAMTQALAWARAQKPSWA